MDDINELDDSDIAAMVTLVAFFEKHKIIYVKSYDGRWIVDLRFRERQHFRCKPQATLWDALRVSRVGREEMREYEAGKRALQEVVHSGIASKEDVEWLLSRFDDKGEFHM